MMARTRSTRTADHRTARAAVRDETSTEPSDNAAEDLVAELDVASTVSDAIDDLLDDDDDAVDDVVDDDDAVEDDELSSIELVVADEPEGFGPLERDPVGVIDRVMRDLLSRHGHAERRRIPQCIGLIGDGPGVGVTTMATSLAHVLSSDFDVRVCYLDLTGKESKRLPNSLADLMSGCASIEDFFDAGADDGVLGAALGELSDTKWHALIRSSRFADTLEQLRKRFGFLVIDLPPMRPDGRTLAAVQHIDGFVLVARHGKSTLSDIETALADLSAVDEIGVVVNRYRPRTPRFLRRWLRVR